MTRCFGCSRSFGINELSQHVAGCEDVDHSWQDRGACLGLDSDLFFPDRGDADTTKAAKAVCRGCDVRSECLNYALRAQERWGIWAGTSEKERRRMRNDLRRKAS